MASTYSTNLAIELIGTGEQSGTWGVTTNTNLGTLLEQAISGYVTQAITDGADTTITIPNGATGVARNIFIEMTGALTAARNLIVPANKKLYFIYNNTTGGFAVTVKVSGQTGVSVPNGKKVILVSNGTDIVNAENYIASLSVGALTSGRVPYASTAGLLTDSANLTFNGTTLTANTIGAFTLSGTVAGGGNQINNVIIGTSTPLAGSFTTINASTSITNAGLTSGRVTYAGASGLLTDSANLLYSGTDLTVYGLTVGRGAGAVSTNTAVGASALATNSSGVSNTATGYQALNAVSTGNNNSAYGRNSLLLNTGSNNTGYGAYTLQANTSGAQNAAFGQSAGYGNTTGVENSFFGTSAGYTNSTGANNVAVGRDSLFNNTTASNNTAVGYQASYSNTTGSGNASLGYFALKANTTQSYNTALGMYALQNAVADGNTAIGFGVMSANTSGASNVAMGFQALQTNTTASENTAVGYQALYSNTTGSSVTAVGHQAGYSTTTAAPADYFGRQAGYSNTTGASVLYMGFQSGYNTTGAKNTFVGANSGVYVTSGYNNTILGRFDGNTGGLDIRTASNYIVLSDGDGNPLISTNSTRSVALNGAVPQTGTGITFPATQSASSNANTLDDYEEGTWTPIDSSGNGLTFSGVSAYYTKIGDMVFATFELTYPATVSSFTNVIGGLPFTVATGADKNGFHVAYTSYTPGLMAPLNANGTSFTLYDTTTTNAINNTALVSKLIRGTCIYKVA